MRCYLSLFLLLICLTGSAHAELPPQALDTVVSAFRDQTQAWESTLQGYAANLFWLLASIDFAWMAIRLVIKTGDIGDWLSELLNRVFFIGFFWTLLLHSSSWSGAIIQSFRSAADGASGQNLGLSPSNLLEAGLTIVTTVWSQVNLITKPAEGILLGFAALIILCCYAFLAALLIEALVQSYVVVSAGVLFMGFGGSRWTAETAKKMVHYAVSVGAKLMIVQLLMGLGSQLVQQLSTEYDLVDVQTVLVVLGIVVVMVVLTKTIPSMIQQLLTGSAWQGTTSVMAEMAMQGMQQVTHSASTLRTQTKPPASSSNRMPPTRWLGDDANDRVMP